MFYVEHKKKKDFYDFLTIFDRTASHNKKSNLLTFLKELGDCNFGDKVIADIIG